MESDRRLGHSTDGLGVKRGELRRLAPGRAAVRPA